MSHEQAYWLVWSQVKGLGPTLIKRLALHFELLENAWKATPIALAQVNGLGQKLIEQIRTQRATLNPVELWEQHRQRNPQLLTPADPEYPRLLWEIPSPPAVLYYAGQINPEEFQGQVPAVGIVGTRFPTDHGSRWTRKISQTLVQSGFTIISGLAAGIDTDAHRSCLRAQGRTIAVLGTGLDLIYPPENRELFAQIAAEGLILSEYPVGVKPERGNFPARNRIIAGLCRAVLVMEAPPKSGALITAKYANEFNRDVFSLPNSPDIQEAHGCLNLIHNGAEMIMSEHQLLASLGAIPPLDLAPGLTTTDRPSVPSTVTPNPKTTEPPADLAPDLLQVLKAVPLEPISLDQIVQDSGLAIAEVSAKLTHLELLDLVQQEPGLRYRRR